MGLRDPDAADHRRAFWPKAGDAQCREALSSLLIYAVPIGAEDLADRLIDRHGSIGAVFSEALGNDQGILSDRPAALALLTAARGAMLRSLQAEILEAPFERARALVDFLRLTMACGEREMVRVLFLSAGAHLVSDEVVSLGSAIAAPMPHREILARALYLDAAGVILAHNHPAGDPTPSRHDIAATRKLVAAASALDIIVHDHLIVARSGWASFRSLGLLPNS